MHHCDGNAILLVWRGKSVQDTLIARTRKHVLVESSRSLGVLCRKAELAFLSKSSFHPVLAKSRSICL